jgi:hypothetical protein
LEPAASGKSFQGEISVHFHAVDSGQRAGGARWAMLSWVSAATNAWSDRATHLSRILESVPGRCLTENAVIVRDIRFDYPPDAPRQPARTLLKKFQIYETLRNSCS